MNNLDNNLMTMRSNLINLTLPTVDMVVQDKDNLRTGMVIFVIQTMATYKIMDNLVRDIISDYAIKKSDGVSMKRIGENKVRVTSNFDKEFIRIDNLKAIENIEIVKITDIVRDKMSIALYKDEAKDFYSFNPHAFNVKYEDETKREVLSTKLITDEHETFEEYADSLRYMYSGTNIKRGDILSFTLVGKSWTCDINGNPVSVNKENFISSRTTSGDIEPAFMMILNSGESFDITFSENYGGTGNIDFGDGRMAVYTAPNLPFATRDQYGVIKVGHNVSVTDDGIISIPNATSYVRGTVIVGANIDVDSSSVISIKKSDKNNFGVIQLGETLTLDSQGRAVVDVSKIATTVGLKEHSDKLASTMDWGHVKVGANIVVRDGVISIPESSRMTLGLVKVGENIDYSNGTISLKYGSDGSAGIVSVGSYLTASDFGRVSVDKDSLMRDTGVTAHMTTVASSIKLGHVKVGKNLTITDDGVLSTHDPYNHPVSHPASIIIQDTNNRFVTDENIRNWNGKLDSNGGQVTGNIIITTDSTISFSRNSDSFSIGFKNNNDQDTDTYAYFETGDNNNEYFKWRHKISGGSIEDWMTLKSDGLRVNGHLVYHTGNKPTKADVGLSNVRDVALNWSWGTANPTHIWGSQGDATQSYVYNGTQLKAFIGLSNVNNWGASSDIGANSTSQYATTNMVAKVRNEKLNNPGYGGVHELGRYLDLHLSGSSKDYDARIWTDGNNSVLTSGDITAGGNVSAVDVYIRSDINAKDKIKRISSALDKISKIGGYTYSYKGSGELSGGVIAQEIETILPSLVSHDGDFKNVKYTGVIALLVEAVKELRELVGDKYGL